MPRGAITDRVPDTGAQRGDGREVLRARAEGQRQIGPETLQWLLAESWDIDPSLFGVVRGVLRTVAEWVAGRGEIPTAGLIVDGVFPPLVHRWPRTRRRPAPVGGEGAGP
ncbi:hypothetical protein [Streptomyces canus]|jgi:hypothetical protein|uniref:hypothetical protein n=1 Tax=Streptomyces canus TaxID=58343 RepID=UPI00225514C0|nr:hypothetical protein [Streptomyces canus]